MSDPRLNQAIDRDTDRVRWADEMAARLENHDYASLDAAGIMEELLEFARSERREVRSRLRKLIINLVMWAQQSERHSGSWRGSIREQRYELEGLLEESPSLLISLHPQEVERIWGEAVHAAAINTEIDVGAFPQRCIWNLENEILAPDWLPAHSICFPPAKS